MNEIQRVEGLLREFLSAIQELRSSGEDIKEDRIDQMTETLGRLFQRLVQLREQQSPADGLPPQGGTQHEIPGAQYPSSNIYGYKYDPKSKNLMVKFMGKDTAEGGPLYRYSGVDQHIYDIIERGSIAPRTSGKNRFHTWTKGVTPSHGASVYALLKMGNHPFTRIS